MMNINDDLDHNIIVKDDYKYDYLVSNLGKSKDKIFEEIEKILA